MARSSRLNCDPTLPARKRSVRLTSIYADIRHGLRRTNADKQRAVDMMILDDEWTKLTDVQIGHHCGVTK
jgi:hypothetical protein